MLIVTYLSILYNSTGARGWTWNHEDGLNCLERFVRSYKKLSRNTNILKLKNDSSFILFLLHLRFLVKVGQPQQVFEDIYIN